MASRDSFPVPSEVNMHIDPHIRSHRPHSVTRLSALALIACLILLSVVAAGCGQRGPRRFSAEWTGSFDTVIQLIAYTEDEAAFRRFENQAQTRFQELHRLYDRYNAYDGINNIHAIVLATIALLRFCFMWESVETTTLRFRLDSSVNENIFLRG